MENRIKLVDDLLNEYRKQSNKPQNPQRVIFKDVEGYDVYNPTAPFTINGKTYIIGRVEKRDSEHSEAVFFIEQEDGTFTPSNELKRYVLQDPYVSFIKEYIVFGGTEIFPHPLDNSKLQWRAKFYYGKSLQDLKELTTGPIGMKDIRLVELSDGRVGVFSRPQGKIGGRGKIGFTIINELEDLNAQTIEHAPLLNQFDDNEWGGVNETTLLKNGKIGILGHIAKFTGNNIRHYYPMVFSLDPNSLEYSNIKIITERENFLPGPAKREDLVDVLFSSGLIRHNNGKATLYTGVSDVEVQKITIDDPFLNFEE